MKIQVDIPAMLDALGMQPRRRGRELWACCPVHEEKTPSWSIRSEPNQPSNGSHYCWGCGFEGGPIKVVMAVIGLQSPGSAKHWLEERGLILGASIPDTVSVELRRPGTKRAAHVPSGVKFGPLEGWGTLAKRYVLSRGVTSEQVDRWKLGYAQSGRLASRLFIPSYDSSGRLASWTARAYAGQDPKYRDPDYEDGADRSVVFGEQWWPTNRADATLILCEGELNALAVERALGKACVGALGGSELDRGQALRISKFGRVVIATDVDEAGSKIAMALRTALHRWRGVQRVHFPKGLDACDVEKQDGPEALAELIRTAS